MIESFTYTSDYSDELVEMAGSTDGFNKDVADTFRSIKQDFQKSTETGGPRQSIDRSVAEAVNADIDQVIEKHSTK